MADKTVSALITEIQLELRQMAGPAVQIYGQPVLMAKINDAFIEFFDDKEINWKRFLDYTTYTLDGTTGQATVAVNTSYAEFGDILSVFPAESDIPLPTWNKRRNPALVSSGYPTFVAPSGDATKVFKVLPVTATGDVVVLGKKRPATWPFDDLEDIVPFDYLAIKHYIVWQELLTDGDNPSATQKAQALFTNRYNTLIDNERRHGVAKNGDNAQVPNRWFDSE